MGGSINMHISCIIFACSKVLELYSLRFVITRRLGNCSIRLRLLLLMLLRMRTNVCWILKPALRGGLVTTLSVHGCIPFLSSLAANRWRWWTITLEALVMSRSGWRRVVVMTWTWVVLVMRRDVDCFICLDVGGCSNNVECVNHRWNLEISHSPTR